MNTRLVKSYSLEHLIHRDFLSSALIPLLFIELFLVALYFGINSYIASENQQTLIAITSDHVQQSLSREAKQIDRQLSEVSRTARVMQKMHEQFFQDLDACDPQQFSTPFAVHANGVYYSPTDKGGASLYYAAGTPMGVKEKRKAACSEQLDVLLKAMVNNNPIITQAYLNTHDNMNRIYPFMPDAPTQYGPGLSMKDYNFYYLADTEHDPTRDVAWTDAYLDPAGQGWMMSAVVPIYKGDTLEGVSGLDVTIDAFVKNVLSIELPWPAGTFMVDGKGVIMAMSESTEQLLGLKELKAHVYKSAVSATVDKPSEFNLSELKNESLKAQFGAILDGRLKRGSATVNIGDRQYLMRHDWIDETGWHLVTLVDEQEILAPVTTLKTLSNRVGLAAVGVMAAFYVLFFFFLLSKSRRLATRIASPVKQLSELTSHLGSKDDLASIPAVGIHEIDSLTENFGALSKELTSRSAQLVQSRVREEIRVKETEILTRLATSDALTGLANRRKAEELLAAEIKREARYHEPFGVIFLDIDWFKSVNDAHGHSVGDDVLREFAGLIQRHVRASDVVARWGGEEFAILCVNAGGQEVQHIGEKIRSTIEAHQFAVVGHVTTSVGGTVYQQGDTTDDIMRRADMAMYEAKKGGRNCCRYFFEP